MVKGVCLAAVVLGLTWWVRDALFRGWESLALGAFTGEEYSGPLTNAPSSWLGLPGNYILEAYPTNAVRASNEWAVVRLRNGRDEVVWTRVLKPEIRRKNGRVDYPFVAKVELQEYRRAKGAYKVLFGCVWGAGGREGGVLTLDGRYEFESFAISW